ncbi:MAG: preprotein translocase subunit YajC [Myxococcota bacterium]
MNFGLLIAELMLAQAEGGAPEGDGGLGSIMGMAPLLLMFLVIYFLLIRPSQKQRKEHQELLTSLKKDDEIVTTGGIYGKIRGIDERVVTLEIADKVKIRILRDRIQGKWSASIATKKQ